MCIRDSDGTDSFIENGTGALKIATETSGIAISIGHTTSEVTVNDNMTVTGNLTVSGTTTTVDTTNTTIKDNLIVLNSGKTGTPGTETSGIEVERGDGTNVILQFNDDGDKWEFTTNGTDFATILTGGTNGNFETVFTSSPSFLKIMKNLCAKFEIKK